jgi:hypothetical protein
MVLLKDAEWSGWADGPRFDEPVTDRFAAEIADDLKTAKALMLTVGESGGCLRGGRRQTRSWTPSNGPAAGQPDG